MKEMKLKAKYIALVLVGVLLGTVALPSLARKKTSRKAGAVVEKYSSHDKLSANDRQRFDYFFMEAVLQQNAGNLSAAFDLLEHARSIDPDAAEVYFYESMYYSQMKKDSVALACMEKSAALNPDNQTYSERLAQYYISTQKFDKAIDAYESVFAHNHENTDALRILMQLYQQKKDYQNMLYTLSRLEREEGESEQLTLAKMRVYEMKGDQKSAYAELKNLADSHPLDLVYKTMLGNWLMQNDRQKEAYKLFTDVLKEEPDNAYAESSLYDYYNATHQQAEARQMLDRILLGNNTPLDTKLALIRSFIQDNESHGADSTQVIALFDKMWQHKPEAEVAVMKATYMSLKKMPVDSVNAAYMQVLELAPDEAGARLQLVQNFWNAKQYDKVIEMTDQAQAYNPEEMVFYYFGGMAHYLKGDDEKTLDTFRKGLAQINDKSSPEIVSDLYMITADILNKHGFEKESFEAYDSCLQWKDDNIPALNNYAYYISLKGKNLQKAEQMSYKTIKAEPKNGTYLDTYAWILFMEERYHESKIYIDQAIANLDSTENNNTVLEHAGDIYAMNGLTDQAMDYWKKSYDGGNKSDVMEQKLKHRRYIPEKVAEKMTDNYSTEKWNTKGSKRGKAAPRKKTALRKGTKK